MFAIWWKLIFGAFRDVGSFAVGVWILGFRHDASVTLQLIAFACLGVSASGVAIRILERVLANGNGSGGRR
jgi:hypothetical protein